jgi:hypothetical protein
VYYSGLCGFCGSIAQGSEKVNRILFSTFILGALETLLVNFSWGRTEAVAFGAAQGIMFANLALLNFLWKAIIGKKKIAHVSILIVLKVLFLFLSAWLILGKIAPLTIWSIGGFFCFFLALTIAASLKRARYEL